MNKEEILKAGRELDELVAEKVMGWVDFWKSQHHLMGYPPQEQNRGVGYDERQPVPQYSTDISAAYEVFEKNGVMGIVGYMGADDCYCVLHSGFHKESGVGQEVHATGKTIPEAICKAALLAVMDS